MKAFSILLFLLFISSVLLSQQFTIASLRPGQTVYIGMDNAISCTVEGVKWEDVFLTTSNGTIEKIKNNTFSFRPINSSDEPITIHKKVKNKLVRIGEYNFRILPFPSPVASVARKSGGLITAKELAVQTGITAYTSPGLSIDIDYTIQSFAVSIMRKEEQFFYAYVKTNRFTIDLKEKFNTLQKGDVVVFSSLSVKLSDSSLINIQPIEFIIE